MIESKAAKTNVLARQAPVSLGRAGDDRCVATTETRRHSKQVVRTRRKQAVA